MLSTNKSQEPECEVKGGTRLKKYIGGETTNCDQFNTTKFSV